LHRMGFFVPSHSRGNAVGSYPTFSPLPIRAFKSEDLKPRMGGLFSVTLSVAAA